jgi:hypothetical protein
MNVRIEILTNFKAPHDLSLRNPLQRDKPWYISRTSVGGPTLCTWGETSTCAMSSQDATVIVHVHISCPPAHGMGYLVAPHYWVRRSKNSLSVIHSLFSSDHPHLPRILGVSDCTSDTPFIIFQTSMPLYTLELKIKRLNSSLSPVLVSDRIHCGTPIQKTRFSWLHGARYKHRARVHC